MVRDLVANLYTSAMPKVPSTQVKTFSIILSFVDDVSLRGL
jgi:hypothetical protein